MREDNQDLLWIKSIINLTYKLSKFCCKRFHAKRLKKTKIRVFGGKYKNFSDPVIKV